jgi:hypothetical protein
VLDNDVIGLATQQPFLALSDGEVFPGIWEKAAVGYPNNRPTPPVQSG